MKPLLAAALAALTAACSTSHPYCGFAPGAADLCAPVMSPDVRLVCAGENHDVRAHHEFQLWTLDAMRESSDAPLLLGMEMFQRQFQAPLDDYVAGRIGEKEMLRRTEYFTRWNFDFTLYAPLWRFAREHGIRIVALNAEGSIITKIRMGSGIAGLLPEERGQLADEIDLENAAHRAQVEEKFKQAGHPLSQLWYEAMTAWDETMAESAARALAVAGPRSRILVVAGNGHCEPTGIPDRVVRRMPGIARVVILSEAKATGEIDVSRPGDAFVVAMPAPEEPPAPRFGVACEPAPDGGLVVTKVTKGGTAADAGIEVGDVIVSLDGDAVADVTDLRWFVDTHRVGDVVNAQIRRGGETRSVSVTLAPPPPPVAKP